MNWCSSVKDNDERADLIYHFNGKKPVAKIKLADFIKILIQHQSKGDDVVELHGIGSLLVGQGYGCSIVMATERQI